MYVHVTAKGAMSFRMDCQPMSWLRSTMQPSRPSRNGHTISTAFRFRSGAKDPERNTLRNAVINWPDGGRRGKEPFPRMGWTGRAPAQNRSENERGLRSTRSTSLCPIRQPVESERLKLPAPLSRWIAEALDADAAR